MRKRLNMLREFSVPLLVGVLTALVWINRDPTSYHTFIHSPVIAGLSVHFITNDIFMVLFFAIAAVEIVQSFHPGGDLNPLKKALNPLFATAGGVIGPVAVYFFCNYLLGGPELRQGWGIPTATDIAFAWLAARLVFGRNHPVVSFLLLLAVADDAVGLAIIAIFYPNPHLPVAPLWLLLTIIGVMASFVLRSARVKSYWPYVLIGGGLSWAGLYGAHLHPALALVFVMPFLPHASRENRHLFEEDPTDLTTLARFEHDWKVVVDLGLFMFGLANAGVELSAVGPATWIVLLSLVVGKTLGIYTCGSLAARFGYPLPTGMDRRDLLVAGTIAGIGFTVALFVAGEAFIQPEIQGAAKMGAMLSIGAAPLALALAQLLRVRRHP